MRVLALEKQVAELRGEKQQQQQDIGDWADESGEWSSPMKNSVSLSAESVHVTTGMSVVCCGDFEAFGCVVSAVLIF